MAAAGLTNRIRETFFPVTKECRVNIRPKTSAKSLKLVDLMASFVACLAVGIGISISTFIIEIMTKVAKIT